MIMKRTLPALLLCLCLPLLCPGQFFPAFYKNYSFDSADSLRGALRPERTCYDVTFYDLHIAVDIDKKFLNGYVDIFFDAVEDFEVLQIDLHHNLEIDQITCYDKLLTFHRLHDAVFVRFPEPFLKGTSGSIRVHYHGYPKESANAPWEGGFVWKKDAKGRPWVGVACQGDGASLWWPNKDHLSDEPDSMAIHVIVPRKLSVICNGNPRGVELVSRDLVRFNWFVSYPINNYNVTLNIGHYRHFGDVYVAQDGDSLDLDFYVLDYNLDKAKKHFQQVKGVLACFEKYLGKYPFWKDGYALVETPYLGMEHQSAIAYGNRYMRGYLGSMIPPDMDWDYIIVHETGHEYFGNALSCTDLAEMWLHESFTTYLEALYVECRYGYEDALRYLLNQRDFITNREPILGPPQVNWHNWNGTDHYFKGAWILHTLRHAIGDDELWFRILRTFYERHSIGFATTQDFINTVNEMTGRDWTAFFRQYLEFPTPPRLLYHLEEEGSRLRVVCLWEAEVPGFEMPVKIGRPGQWVTVQPNTEQPVEVLLEGVSKQEFEVATDLFLIRKKAARLLR